MAETLVGYASKLGSTREVAERVAARLTERGLQVDLLAAGEVRSLAGYDDAVFRGALYNPGMKSIPVADLRDWKVIEAWADSLPEKLGMKGK